jgi:tripartite-type tricarboxylate transporter receptor subunit TctC
MHRRTLLHGALAAGIGAHSIRGLAQGAYPSRPITLVVPFAAGGGGDVVARLLAKELGERLKTTIVVENRVGAGGNIGSAYVLKSKPDGYTLLNMSSTYAIQAALTKAPFDPIGDMQPIVMVSRDPGVVVVQPNSPLRTAKDLAAAAKASPGKLTYGSAGVGSIAHIGMEELAFNMGVQLTHVPYKGSSQAFTDVMAGQVDMMLTSVTYASGTIKSGRIRALGIASAQRSPALPDIPTFAEQGWPDFLLVDWKAVAAPRGVPPEVVTLLNRELNEVLRGRNVAERFTAEGTTPVGGTPEQMMRIVQSDVERWRALAKRANLKIE